MARAKQIGPRYGSRARAALEVLLRAGAMSQVDWMVMLNFNSTHTAFDRDIVQPLLGWKLIQRTVDEFAVNDAGRRFLGVLTNVEVLAQPAPAREVYIMKPLSTQRRPLRQIIRPGALDYRDIPSRCASVSVPFKSSIKSES